MLLNKGRVVVRRVVHWVVHTDYPLVCAIFTSEPDPGPSTQTGRVVTKFINPVALSQKLLLPFRRAASGVSSLTQVVFETTRSGLVILETIP